MKTLKASLAALLLCAGAGACAQIAGIEDRNFVEQQVNATDAACEEYCKIIEDKDPEDDKPDDGVCPNNYTTYDVCIGVCGKFEPGDPSEPTNENTVACRLNAARAARSASEGEVDSFCQAAGPGGNGACGSNCESYCRLVEMEGVCGERNVKVPNCVEKCEAFGDSNRFHVGTPTQEFDHSGDTVQCRLVHVSTAAGSLATDALKDTHCAHADFHSTQWCIADEPSCSRYCDVLEVACRGDNEVYENRDQCLGACAELELGEPLDDIEDTIGCRTWHAVSSLSDPNNHCSHAGPTGDGHCGLDDPPVDPTEFAACRPYCRLIEAACPTEFASTFGNNGACVSQCDDAGESFGADADQDYTVKSVIEAEDGDTLSCRTLHAVRALGAMRALDDDATEDERAEAAAEFCPAVFGAAPCD
ncbi:MAG TPA: hypothetical protein VI197_29450 [Polyangiaceae bacterium]